MEQTHSKSRKREPILSCDCDSVVRQTEELVSLDEAALKQKWAAVFGTDPPSNLGRSLMLRAISYRIQERAFGPLKASARRFLDSICDGQPETALKRLPKTRVGAGTVLIREWRGVRHRVTVLDRDVVYRGQRYRSLTEVASLITGTHWSGPMFFGLRRRVKKEVGNG